MARAGRTFIGPPPYGLPAAGRRLRQRGGETLRLLLFRHRDDRALLALGSGGGRGRLVDRRQAQALAQAPVDLLADVLVVAEELARVVAPLAHALAVEGV